MNTTADSPNRIRDKQRVENQHPLLTEEGKSDVALVSKQNGCLIATGYVRVVYGDHGPYIEFTKDQHKSSGKYYKKHEKAWYDEIWCDGTKIYIQRKDVSMLPNPPAGKYSAFNNRKEGYADYKVGMYYVSPDDVDVITIKK